MTAELLSQSLQESFLTVIAFDASDDGEWIAAQLSADMFDTGIHRIIAKKLLDFRKEYSKPPGREHLDDVLDELLKKHRHDDRPHPHADACRRIMDGMYAQASGLNAYSDDVGRAFRLMSATHSD